MCVYEKIKELGIIIPKVPASGGVYTLVKEFGTDFVYVSGQGPIVDGNPIFRGKIGETLTLEQGQESAYICMLNVLSALQDKIIDLNRVKRAVKILAFVASSENFYKQPDVINSASQLLINIFGEDKGKAARSAIGTNVLPGNIPVEIEALFELA